MKTLIRGGTVVSPSGRTPADVLVDGETIAAVLAPGQADALGVAVAANSMMGESGRIKSSSPKKKRAKRKEETQ